MASPAEQPTPVLPVSRGWLGVAWLAALSSIVLVFAPFVYFIAELLHSEFPNPGWLIFQNLLWPSLLALPYLGIAWALRRRPRKFNLDLTLVVALLATCPMVALLAAVIMEPSHFRRGVPWYAGLFVLTQVVLAFAALKLRRMAVEIPGQPSEVDAPWLWAVRGALLACLMFLLLYGVAEQTLAVLPWAIPYLVVLAGERSRRRRDTALLLGMATGAVGMVVWLGIFLAGQTWTHSGFVPKLDKPENALSGLSTVAHLVLLVAARKLTKKPSLWVRGVRGVIVAVAALALLLTAFWMVEFRHAPRGSPNESSAVGSLRTIVSAQVAYDNVYPKKGFAATLTALGPPPPGAQPSAEAADFIDSTLVKGEKNGYRFTLTPGPRDPSGRTTSFTAGARPMVYRRTGVRSFFVDETGVVCWTAEDRPATAQDPPL